MKLSLLCRADSLVNGGWDLVWSKITKESVKDWFTATVHKPAVFQSKTLENKCFSSCWSCCLLTVNRPDSDSELHVQLMSKCPWRSLQVWTLSPLWFVVCSETAAEFSSRTEEGGRGRLVRDQSVVWVGGVSQGGGGPGVYLSTRSVIVARALRERRLWWSCWRALIGQREEKEFFTVCAQIEPQQFI